MVLTSCVSVATLSTRLKNFIPLPVPGIKMEYKIRCKLGEKLKVYLRESRSSKTNNQNRKVKVGDFTSFSGRVGLAVNKAS